MNKVLGALIIAISLAIMAVASAHVRNESDPNDSRSPLDLKQISFDHNGQRFIVGLETFETWANRALRKKGEFSIAIDTGSGSHFVVKVRERDGELKVPVFRRFPDMDRIGYGNATKEDRRSVQVTVRRELIKGYRGPVKWSPASFFKSRKICENRCDDLAPNASQGYWFHHRL